jgi:hypothetical protein
MKTLSGIHQLFHCYTILNALKLRVVIYFHQFNYKQLWCHSTTASGLGQTLPFGLQSLNTIFHPLLPLTKYSINIPTSMIELPWLNILHTVPLIGLWVPRIHNTITTIITERIQNSGTKSYSKYPLFMKIITVHNRETTVGRSTYWHWYYLHPAHAEL